MIDLQLNIRMIYIIYNIEMAYMECMTLCKGFTGRKKLKCLKLLSLHKLSSERSVIFRIHLLTLASLRVSVVVRAFFFPHTISKIKESIYLYGIFTLALEMFSAFFVASDCH